jgi:hypothetical protein
LLITSVTTALAQRIITGKVTDEKGEALIGAGVQVKGSTAGSVTDIDGMYSLQIPEGATHIVVNYNRI